MSKKKLLSILLLILLSFLSLGWLLQLLGFVLSIRGIGNEFGAGQIGYATGMAVIGILLYSGFKYCIKNIKKK